MIATVPYWLQRADPLPEPPPGAGFDWTSLFGWLLVIAVLVGVGAWIWWRRQAPSSERAFRALANRLLLGPRARGTLRRLARAHGRATPAALILSPTAFEHALNKLRASDPESDEATIAERLAARLSRA